MYESTTEKISMSPEQVRLFAVLHELSLPADQYVLTGSAAMTAQGVERRDEQGNVTSFKDIDVIVTPECFANLKKSGQWQNEFDDGGEKLLRNVQGVECEAFTNFEISGYARNAADLLQSAAMVENVPCMSFSELIAFKQSRNLPKDQRDIAVMKAYL